MPRKITNAQIATERFMNANNYNVEYLGNSRRKVTCCSCGDETMVSRQTISNWVSGRINIPTCKSSFCSPVVPEGFRLLEVTFAGEPRIQCCDCGEAYMHHKKTAYFVCYCHLKTKVDEHRVYKALRRAGCRPYREVYFDKALSKHKVDLKVWLEDGREIFLEIDGIEHHHGYRLRGDRDFETLFLEHREETQFLLRIPSSVSTADLRILAQRLEDLDYAPFSHFVGTDELTDPVFRILE